MVEVSPATAILLYLGLTIGVILSLWGFGHYRTRSQKISTSALSLWACEYCCCAYLSDSAKEVTQCPHCNSFNKH